MRLSLGLYGTYTPPNSPPHNLMVSVNYLLGNGQVVNQNKIELTQSEATDLRNILTLWIDNPSAHTGSIYSNSKVITP